MADLTFRVESAEAVPYAVAPQLVLKLRVENRLADESVHAFLQCQVRIDPTTRFYSPAEQELLLDLFGEPRRWGRTLRSMLWTHVAVMVPGFRGGVTVDLPLPCTFDVTLAVSRYLDALTGGDVPLHLLFSGTVFRESEDGLQAGLIPWDREAKYRLPVDVWRRMMDVYYPNVAWLALRRDLFDRLQRLKTARTLPTWEQLFERLLDTAEREKP
jgi:hypothetical protein